MGLHEHFDDVEEETSRWVLGLGDAPVGVLKGTS
jgi:hypothetical protein